MSRSRTLVRWMPVVVLALLPVLHAVVAGAAPLSAAPVAAPMLGFTPTATTPPPCEGCCPYGSKNCPTPCPTCTPSPPSKCDPVITKGCKLVGEGSGRKVTFTIQVTNRGQQASVNAKVIDEIPEYLEILRVTTTQGKVREPIEGQRVIVDVGTIGQDYVVTIVVYTRVRENAPTRVPVQNLARFEADNCPDRQADCSWVLPSTGGSSIWWTVVGGLGTVVLVVSLVLARRERS